jgi:hypothetical protein
VLGLLLKAATVAVRQRRFVISPEHRRFVLGCLAALLILLPTSALVARRGPVELWGGFIRNSQKHLHTPLTNNMGLKTVVAYELKTRAEKTRDFSAQDPFRTWKAARLAAAKHRRLIFMLLAVAFLSLLARAAADEPDWVALVLGVGAICVLAEITCYYYSFALAFGLLWARRQSMGVWTSAIAAVSCAVCFVFPWEDDREVVLSLLSLALVTASIYQPSWALAGASRYFRRMLFGLGKPGSTPTEATIWSER